MCLMLLLLDGADRLTTKWGDGPVVKRKEQVG
jgi:hypothetical protein